MVSDWEKYKKPAFFFGGERACIQTLNGSQKSLMTYVCSFRTKEISKIWNWDINGINIFQTKNIYIPENFVKVRFDAEFINHI